MYNEIESSLAKGVGAALDLRLLEELRVLDNHRSDKLTERRNRDSVFLYENGFIILQKHLQKFSVKLLRLVRASDKAT